MHRIRIRSVSPDKLSSWSEDVVTLAKMLLALLLAMGDWDSVSLKGVGPGKLPMLQQMFLNTCSYRVH